MNYEKFFKEHYAGIKRYIGKFVLDTSDVDDLTQETFISFFRVDKTGKVMNGSINYLYVCAKNKSMDYLRDKKVYNTFYNKYIDIDQDIIDTSIDTRIDEKEKEYLFQLVLREAQNFKSKGGKIMWLFYIEGMEPEKICKIMNIQKHSVYTHKNRMVEKLREKFGVVKK